ncbi:hypothetical protein [Leptospira stimsonii]|uniref:Lipoprotein n=1 Tax=Leptospira stimsonii TaxID=2202203 RepID=A0A396ZE06_9LEPT|nr:hypothetical protein [Leptospira stimsonii]RHX92493.1 hypothetical protein DLM75_04715 [Leptospira stimsonii]
MKFKLAIVLGFISLTLSNCVTTSHNPSVIKQGLTVDKTLVWSRPADFAAEIQNDKIEGSVTAGSWLWGYIPTGDQGHSSPRIFGASYSDPLILNAIAAAVKKANVDGFYVVRVTVEKTVGFIGFTEDTTVKVEGKSVKLKYIGTQSEQKADDARIVRILGEETAASVTFLNWFKFW